MTQPGTWSGGAIALTLRYFPLAFIFGLITPVVTVNGRSVRMGWGSRTVIPVEPGQHQVHVHAPYFLPSRIGPADLVVPVQPGQTVELEYKAPLWSFSPGSLGAPPQSYNGRTAMIALMALLAALVGLPLLCGCIAGLMSMIGGDPS